MITIKEINRLREIYDIERSKGANTHEAINAYHSWLEASATFFSNHFHPTDNDFVAFKNFDITGSGYSLESIYNQQRYTYSILINRINTNQTSNKVNHNDVPKMLVNKKIFISHSSEDSCIVDQFIDKILRLGCGFNVEEIAYTSREDTGVRTGEDIRNFIKENISFCDIVFFMISNNYKNSEICLNEMGAAWAIDRNVKPIVLPESCFDSIGWLYNVNKGIKIDNSDSLDALYDDICSHYDMTPKITTWNKYKSQFLEYLANTYSVPKDQSLVVLPKEPEELDLLDYREIFDDGITEYTKSLLRLAEKQTVYNEIMLKYVSEMEIMAKLAPSTKDTRIMMKKLAIANDKLSAAFEEEMPILSNSFEEAVNAGLSIREIATVDSVDVEEERQSIMDLTQTMRESKSILVNNKSTLDNDKINLEKNFTQSNKRLSDNYTKMISMIDKNFLKANKLFINT